MRRRANAQIVVFDDFAASLRAPLSHRAIAEGVNWGIVDMLTVDCC